MVVFVFDLEVCTVRFTMHRQNSRKRREFCKFLTKRHALLADYYGETEFSQQPLVQ